jgi:hypothetical protein
MTTPIHILAVLVLGVSLSDTWSVSGKPEVENLEQRPRQPDTIAELFNASSDLEQLVRLVGRFQGYRIADCHFPVAASAAGVTRSDWLFRTGGDCVYVTGGAPAGVDPIDPAYTGRRVEIRAEVVKSPTGKVVLRLVEGRLLAE